MTEQAHTEAVEAANARLEASQAAAQENERQRQAILVEHQTACVALADAIEARNAYRLTQRAAAD